MELDSHFILVGKVFMSGAISLGKNDKIFENEDKKWRRKKSTSSLFAIWKTFFIQWYLWKSFLIIFIQSKVADQSLNLIFTKKQQKKPFLGSISETFGTISSSWNIFLKIFFTLLTRFRYYCKRNVFHIAKNEEVDFFLLHFSSSCSHIV